MNYEQYIHHLIRGAVLGGDIDISEIENYQRTGSGAKYILHDLQQADSNFIGLSLSEFEQALDSYR